MDPKLITYDLHAQRDYQRLWDALAILGACRAMLSVWIYRGPLTASQVRTHLGASIDSDDSLFVAEFTNWSARGLTNEQMDCIGPWTPE